LQRRLPLILLLLILLIAFGIRLRGITYGIPGPYVPDEYEKIAIIMKFRDGEFTHAAHQPSFLFNTFYLFARVMEPFRERILSGVGADRLAEIKHDWVYHLWVGRLWMVLISTATCAAVFALGRRVAGSGAGLAAAGLFALSPLSIAASHYIKEDTPLTFWMCVALLACLSVAEKGRWRDYLIAGLLCGITFGAKYPGGLTLVALIGAHFLAPRESARAHLRPLAGVGMAVAGFGLTSPAIFVHLRTVVQGVHAQAQYMQGGHHDGIRILPWGQLFTWYLREGLLPGMTIGPLLAGIAGLACLWKLNRKLGIVLGGWVLFYYLLAEFMPSKPYPFFARYVMPLVPFLCVGAGVAAVWLWMRVRSQHGPQRVLAAAVCALIFATPLYATTRFLRHILPDTRDTATEWIEERATTPRGIIVVDGDTTFPYAPRLDPAKWEVLPLTPENIDRARAEDGLVVLNSFSMQRYFDHPDDVPEKSALYRDLLEEGTVLKEFARPHAQYGFHNPRVTVLTLQK
jgi:hypothetical protein